MRVLGKEVRERKKGNIGGVRKEFQELWERNNILERRRKMKVNSHEEGKS